MKDLEHFEFLAAMTTFSSMSDLFRQLQNTTATIRMTVVQDRTSLNISFSRETNTFIVSSSSKDKHLCRRIQKEINATYENYLHDESLQEAQRIYDER
jgi:hypothetical protein